MDPSLSEGRRIGVDELVVYGTGIMESFKQAFMEILERTKSRPERWVVVFSPTGCEAMLRALKMLDLSTGKVYKEHRIGGQGMSDTYVVTIGPTTRDFLKATFDYEPDVCAAKPSQEGVGKAIREFMEKKHGTPRK